MSCSRAVRVGGVVHVSGCLGVRLDGSIPGTLAAELLRCLREVEAALGEAGARLDDLVRLRIYTTLPEAWEDVADVLRPLLEDVRPALTLVGVSRLVDPEARILVEAEAVIAGG